MIILTLNDDAIMAPYYVHCFHGIGHFFGSVGVSIQERER